MSRQIKIADTDEIPPNGGRCFEIEDRRIAVFHVNGEFYAIDNRCTHADASLADGWLEDGPIVCCPLHGAQFDLETGEALSLPAIEGVVPYPITVSAGALFITLD